MAITVLDAIKRTRRHAAEMDPATVLEYLDEVHSDLLTTLPMVADTVDISLVAGQREYVIAETNVRVWSASLYQSAQDFRNLLAIDKTELNIREPNWRRSNNGIVSRFYVDRNATDIVVGFQPPPITATSGTYPFVRLYVTTEATLTMASSLPKGIASMDVYVFGVMRRFLAGDPKAYEHWDRLFQQAMQAEIAKYHGMNVQKKPSIIPNWIPGGGIA